MKTDLKEKEKAGGGEECKKGTGGAKGKRTEKKGHRGGERRGRLTEKESGNLEAQH